MGIASNKACLVNKTTLMLCYSESKIEISILKAKLKFDGSILIRKPARKRVLIKAILLIILFK